MDELTNDIYIEQLQGAYKGSAFESENDPNGSYTGNNLISPDHEPEQDADDL